MKLRTLVLSAAVFLCAPGFAQTPAAATSGSVTATCKDGTNYTGKSMKGACRGHGGVEKSAAKKGDASKAASRSQAPGGGPGKVWANSQTKVYHCEGDRHYGKTKQGSYMSEAEAKAQGFRAARGKACAAS